MKYLIHSIGIAAFIIVMMMACTPSLTSEGAELSESQKRMTQHALAGLEVGEGLEAKLLASEPWLINPTNIDIDARGRIWVCEAYNYRFHLNPDNPTRDEGDRIVILEDTDEDGEIDKSTVFYQGTDINSALGIAVLGDRVFVSVSPNVFIFTDEDGDDQPDKKETLFTGIKGEQHDHGMHAFVFGPDGRLYFNYGNAGEQLTDPSGEILTDIHGYEVAANGKPFHHGMIFRCEPDGSNIEVLAHNFRNNYEVALDSYGGMWQSDNDDDGNRGVRINYVMEYGNYGYRDEMTGAGWRDRRTGMHDEIPKRHWHLNDPGVVPNLLQTGAGSPTGMAVYEGDLLPERFQGQAVHCDAGPNVVRAYPAVVKGAGYKARIENILKGARDNWFRPSDVCVAPDGSLVVADWYDPGVGGHKMGDQERGRLFRIAPPGHVYKKPNLDLETPAAALEALKSPNMATRYLAWQQFAKWQERGEPALQGLWADENPRFRARALWLLARIPAKTQAYIDEAIGDKHPDIRITALRAARQLLPDQVPAYVHRLVKDTSPQVRREALIALRHYQTEEAAELWARLAAQYVAGDRWYLEALGIGADLHPDACFKAWMKTQDSNWNTPTGRDIVWRLRAKKTMPLLATMIKDTATSEVDMIRYFRGFDFHENDRRNQTLSRLIDLKHPKKDLINRIAFTHIDPKYIRDSRRLSKALERSLEGMVGTEEYLAIVENQDLRSEAPRLLNMAIYDEDNSLRVNAIRLLLEFNKMDGISAVLDSSESQANRLINALGSLGNSKAREMLKDLMMESDRPLTLRKAAVQALGSGWSGEHQLMRLLEAGEIPDALVQVAAVRLTSSIDQSLRPKAATYLDEGVADTKLPAVEELITQSGDIAAGQLIFEQTCATCHQVGGAGVNFGPDLSEIGNKLSKEALYAAIFYPSAGINFGYEGYLITLKDGSVVSGFISSETETSISVRMNGGITQTYEVDEVVKKEQMDISLMPEGLHTTMSVEELVNLVTYLESLGKSIAGR